MITIESVWTTSRGTFSTFAKAMEKNNRPKCDDPYSPNFRQREIPVEHKALVMRGEGGETKYFKLTLLDITN